MIALSFHTILSVCLLNSYVVLTRACTCMASEKLDRTETHNGTELYSY